MNRMAEECCICLHTFTYVCRIEDCRTEIGSPGSDSAADQFAALRRSLPCSSLRARRHDRKSCIRRMQHSAIRFGLQLRISNSRIIQGGMFMYKRQCLLLIGQLAVAVCVAVFATSCGELGGVLEKKAQTNGGSETGGAGGAGIVPPNPADIDLPPGYHAEVVATGFTFPTGVTFDEANVPYVVESGYAYGEKYAPGRLVRIEPGGAKTVIAEGANQPWTGVAYHNGSFFISQGGYPGKIARVSS